VVGAVLLAGLRAWWGWEAERRLSQRVAAYRAAGQPVLSEDFALPPISDEKNAAVALRQASALLGKLPDTPVPFSNLLVPDVQAQHRDFVAQFLHDQTEALRLLRAARDCQAARWGTVLASPVIDVCLRDVGWQRDLAKLLMLTAIHRHQTADDAEAVESIRDMLALARHVEDGEPFLMTHLVRVAIDALATQAVEDICRDLRVAPAGVLPGDGSAPRQTVLALIAELLDERSLQTGGQMAMYGERLLQLDCVQRLTAGQLGLLAATKSPSALERVALLVMAPAWKLDGLGMLERTTRLAEAIVADNWPDAQSKLPARQPAASGPVAAVRLISSVMEPSLDRAVLIHFRVRVERRLAATALAIRLFEIDHGRRPSSLTALVPHFLAAVPSDPFATANTPVRYLPDTTSPRLYSVGSNGVDDGGAFGLKTNGAVDPEVLDQPFFLNGDRPRSQPIANGLPSTSP